jgi:beta-galactosidase
MLTLEHGGRKIEYIPFKMGFGITGFDGGNILRGDGKAGDDGKASGEAIKISAIEGDFPVRKGTLEKLRAAKKRKVNTVCVTRPQQQWFYDMCASEGLWVIDRAAVECDPRDGDRGLDGTVANHPSYLARFLDRQQAMFYRNRNRVNVIGWSVGSESGNGYNMYKSYQLLKSLDTTRPVIYEGAEGEWNTDTITNYELRITSY